MLWEDNQACLAWASNPVSSKKTKHVDVRCHLSRDSVARGEVVMEYMSTAEMVSDGLTKSLPALVFQAFRKALGVRDVSR